jgi:hypothetical protein
LSLSLERPQLGRLPTGRSKRLYRECSLIERFFSKLTHREST